MRAAQSENCAARAAEEARRDLVRPVVAADVVCALNALRTP